MLLDVLRSQICEIVDDGSRLLASHLGVEQLHRGVFLTGIAQTAVIEDRLEMFDLAHVVLKGVTHLHDDGVLSGNRLLETTHLDRSMGIDQHVKVLNDRIRQELDVLLVELVCILQIIGQEHSVDHRFLLIVRQFGFGWCLIHV